MAETPKKVLFVINKRSGRKKTDRESIIRQYVKDAAWEAGYFIMPAKNAGEKLAQKIADFGPHIAVAVGGDGTVSLVAEHIMKKNIIMAIVPAGSANGMARELEIPDDTLAALELITRNHTINCDLLQVNRRWLCMHLSDLGLNARLVKYFQEGPLRGLIGYAIALVKALRRKTNLHTSITTKDGVKKTEAMMVLFANASKFGTGATINHEGSLTDGYFEVIIIRKIGPKEIWKMFFGSKGFNPDNIELHQASLVQVETTKPAHLQVDGEYLGKVNSAEARIIEEKLQVFVP